MIDPNEALQKLLQPDKSPTAFFPATSRYYGMGVSTIENTKGAKVAYLERRFLPALDRFDLLQEHVVTQGERLDNITAHYFGDPEQFWRLCDANGAMRPQELEEVGRRLRITLPEGIPGIPSA
jgi:hypothetical protein